MNSPQNVGERLCLLGGELRGSRDTLLISSLAPLKQLLSPFLLGLKAASFLGVALDFLRSLLMLIVDMLLYRVGCRELIEDFLLLVVLG